jgi:branched-chain amino acid aminotransferase
VGELAWRGRGYPIAGGGTGALAARLFEELTAIQYGQRPDPYGWVHAVAPSAPEAPLAAQPIATRA